MKSRSPHYVDYGLNSPPPAVRGASYLPYSLSFLPPFPFIIGYQIPRRPLCGAEGAPSFVKLYSSSGAFAIPRSATPSARQEKFFLNPLTNSWFLSILIFACLI